MANKIAYGFVGLKDVFGQRVNQIGVETLRTAIAQSASAYNEEIGAILSTWAQVSTTSKERVVLSGSGTLQSLDQWGNPLPIKPSGYYDAGYPIQGGGTAWGTNRISAALLTVEEANRFTTDAFIRDQTWLRAHMLGAILDNTSWNYEDPQLGTLTVMPLANGDTVVYDLVGAGVGATHQHYLAQAAAISDAANPFPTIYQHLLHHPSNSEPFVVYVPTNLLDAIEGLADFTPQPDPDVIAALTQSRLSNTGTDAIKGPGNQIMGKANRCWIVNWRSLPDNYMVAVSLGAAPFLRQREYDAPGLTGLFPEFNSPDGNVVENRFLRYCGFGVRDRVAALVYQIGNATYQIPTGYSTPLP